MIKNLLTIILLVMIVSLAFTETEISFYSVKDFYEEVRLKESFTPSNTRYIWTGMITAITEKDFYLEVTLIKSYWIGEDLLTYPFILQITSFDMKKQLITIGLYRKVFVLLEVKEIQQDMIPLCKPLLLDEL